MPYLTIDEKELTNAFGSYKPGQLNYLLTRLCLAHLDELRSHAHSDYNSYTDYNEVVGALESCKLEFYRRAVVPYEDKKIVENGDVY